MLTVAALSASAALLSSLGGAGRAVEAVAVGMACLVSYRIAPRGRVSVNAGLLLVLFAAEGLTGRLDRAHAWTLPLLISCFVLAVASASRHRTDLGDRLGGTAPEDDLEAPGEIEALLRLRRELQPLEYELQRSRRHDHQLTLLIVRSDPPPGEERSTAHSSAAAVADAIGRVLRATDVPLHLREDEFWVVLPETPAQQARIAAERVRLAVAGGAETTVSVGTASFPEDAKTNDALIEAARAAVADATARGGNRTIHASVPPGVPPGWGMRIVDP